MSPNLSRAFTSAFRSISIRARSTFPDSRATSGERRASVAVGRVHRGARREEPRGHRHPAPRAGLRQRRLAARRPGRRRSPSSRSAAAPRRRGRSRRPSAVPWPRCCRRRRPRRFGRAGTPTTPTCPPALAACSGGPAGRVLGGDQFGVLLDESPDRGEIPGAGGVVNRRLLSEEDGRSEDDGQGESAGNRGKSAHTGLGRAPRAAGSTPSGIPGRRGRIEEEPRGRIELRDTPSRPTVHEASRRLPRGTRRADHGVT